MNGKDWLRKRVRVFAAYDWRKEHAPIAVGEVVGYIDGPSIHIRHTDGSQSTRPVSLPIDVLGELAGDDAALPLADWERELLREQDEKPVGYPPYDPDKFCPKCGTEDVSTAWHHGNHIWTGYGVTVGRWDVYEDCPDWLLRTCTCCSYAWPEAPMDQDAR